MKARISFCAALIALIAVASAFSACAGNSGSDQDKPAVTADTGSATPTLRSGATARVGVSEADKKYISEMCAAIKPFNAAMDKADSQKFESGLELIKAVGGPFNTYAKAIAAITPPADLRTYHSKVTSDLTATAKALGEGRGLEGLDALAIATIQLPPETLARLQRAAVGNAECNGSPFVP